MTASLLVCCIPICFAAKPKAPLTLSASECGAAGDGKTLNTEVLQAAIDRIGQAGGGTLVLRDGCFLTGGLFLRSNVELRIEAGATLLGSTNPYDYTAINMDNIPAGRGMDSSRMGLIVAQGVDNVKISGYGTIDGQGRALARRPRDDQRVDSPVDLPVDELSRFSAADASDEYQEASKRTYASETCILHGMQWGHYRKPSSPQQLRLGGVFRLL